MNTIYYLYISLFFYFHLKGISSDPSINIVCFFLKPTISPHHQVAITGEWSPWQNKVPVVEVETHKVASPDVVIPTVDTVRHESLLFTWLAEHKPLVLCGPPGSGKTMTLFCALRSLPDMEVSEIWNKGETQKHISPQLFYWMNICIDILVKALIG